MRAAAGLAAAAIALAACGGGSPSADETSGDSGAVGFDGAQGATVKIEALGAFVDPYEGALEGGWWGSGLIIDSSGLAVTNNHVVVGAATLKVQVDGEEFDAQIRGVSECLDLAVIDIEGDGFPFFDWYEGDVKGALEVWALGYPAVGDTSFTITRGIVSKPDTPSDTQWASLNHAIEHDARIRGGNSGGPLIAEDGSVVGVNYAGDDQNDLNLAIHRDEVLRVLPDLQKDIDVLSLGVNGSAFVGDGGSGVFVSGVASGSPADRAGLEPGDIITRMEGVSLATDGTLADYCSVLRTHGQEATLAVEVFRPSDGVTYAGQFNGDALEAASLPDAGSGGGSTGGGSAPESSDLTMVTDDSGRISVQVPSSWAEVDGAEYTDDGGNLVYDVSVSSSLSGFYETWGTSGVSVAASSDWLSSSSVDALLDREIAVAESGSCSIDGREPYSDALYTGSFDWYYNCGGVGTNYVVIAATADDGTHATLVRIQLISGEEWAVEPIVGSFQANFSG